ncbi:MAG: dTDP-4-amino-4,6-dideoxygalactose transaminase, partial [Planctomycetota bacterium]
MTRPPELREQWTISCLVPDLPQTVDIIPYLQEIDKNRWYSNFGPLQRQFENVLSGFLAEKYGHQLRVVTLSSATAVLELTLQAMKLRQGARILLPSLTFPATILAVLRCGYTPVLADVDADSWALHADYALKAAQTTAIDAVLPVAAFGYPLPIASWESFQAESGIPVLIDAAGALGVQTISAEVPVIFSLHATKPLGIGEGGALVTSNEGLADDVRQLSNFGFGAGEIEQAGTNAK